MFAIITKSDYWSYLERGALKQLVTIAGDARHDIARIVRPGPRSRAGTSRLKDIQDAFFMDAMQGVSSESILELGGGDSRILRVLARSNTCWNVDKLEGEGGGPIKTRLPKSVRIVRDYMGKFNREIPDNAFDFVVSVSAVEHIPDADFADAMRDCYRVLKPGGRMLHAVDLYLFDRPDQHPFAANTQRRLKLYRSVPEITKGGMDWIEPPLATDKQLASAAFAANHSDELHYWNHTVPALKDVRAIAMSCSLRMGLSKVA